MADRPENYDLEVNLPVPDGLRVTGDHPYRILIVNDWAGSDAGSISGPLADGVVDISPDTFDEVLARTCPAVGYTTADPLAAINAMVEVNLRFDSLRAFHPQDLLQQIPAAASLWAARRHITDRLHGRLSTTQLTEAISRLAASDSGCAWLIEALKWSPAKPAADSADMGTLLDQIDLGNAGAPDAAADAAEPPSPAPKSPVGAIVAAAAREGASLGPQEATALRRALADLDSRLQVWITTVLHAPQIQAVEAAWRSLAFLVAQTDFRKGVRLSLLHAPRGELTERFRTRLIDPIFDQGANSPDLIIVDYQFGNTAADLETLDETAQHAASLPAVALAGLSSSFFGAKFAWQVPSLPPLNTLLDQWQFAKWKSLRGQSYAHSLGLIYGRCLLRPPHSAEGGKDAEFAYHEPCLTDKDLLWAGGPIAAACTVARSIAETGWPTGMAGLARGRVEGFAVAQGGKAGDKQFGPCDMQMAQEKIEELAWVGINAAVGLRDFPDAIVWNGLTAARPKKLDTGGLLEVSLPYQLFAGRLSSLLFLLKPDLANLATERIVSFVHDHVRSWLPAEPGSEEDPVKVQVGSPPDEPSTRLLAVTVTPPKSILPGGVPVVLGYRLS